MAVPKLGANLEDGTVEARKPGTDTQQCQLCEKQFSRPEHLRRHVSAHTENKIFGCPFCTKNFTRKDAAQRHLLIHNEGDDQNIPGDQKPPRRACTNCRDFHLKCTGLIPCHNCARRSRDCRYLPNKRKRALEAVPHEPHLPSHHEDLSLRQAQLSSVFGQDDSSGRYTDAESSSELYLTEDGSIDANDGPGRARVRKTGLPYAPKSTLHHKADGPNTSKDTLHSDSENLQTLSHLTKAEQRTGKTQSVGRHQSVSSATCLDTAISDAKRLTLNDPIANVISPSRSQLANLMTPDSLESLERSCNTSTSKGALIGVHGTFIHTPKTLQQKSDMKSQPQGAEIQRAQKSLTMAMKHTNHLNSADIRKTQTEDARSRRRNSCITSQTHSHLSATSTSGSTLDLHTAIDYQVRQIQSQRHTPCSVSMKTYEEILAKLMAVPLASAKHFHPFSTERFLSVDTIDYFVQLYFEKFHMVYPFLDRSLLSLPVWGSYVTLAAAAIGARYMVSVDAETCSDTLCRLLHQVLTQEYDHNATDESLAYVQARALTVVGLCHSRITSWTEVGHRSLSIVFAASIRLGLLEEISEPDWRMESSDVEHAWLRWRVRESRRRTGLFVWMLNSIISFTSYLPSQLPLKCLNIMLPSSEQLWQATTSQAWQKLHDKRPENCSVQETLHLLYTQGKLKYQVSDFASMGLIHCLVQCVSEARHHHNDSLSQKTTSESNTQRLQSPSGSGASRTTTGPEITKWQSSACDALVVLHREALGTSPDRGGLEGPVFLKLHLARLVLLSPVQELQGMISALAAQSQSSLQPYACGTTLRPYEECRKTIWTWIQRDLHKARLAVVHAAAIFWYIRQYHADCFTQPFAIFLATSMLSIYGSYVRESRQLNQSPSRDDDVNRDDARLREEIQQKSNTTECSSGYETDGDDLSTPSRSPTPTMSHLPTFVHMDRSIDNELAQQFIRSGHNMRLFMEGVGELCTTDGPILVLREGARLLRAEIRVWPIAERFATTLEAAASKQPTEVCEEAR